MAAAPGTRRQASLVEGLRGLVDMGASTLRGGVASTLGVPGDIGEIINKLRGKEDSHTFPTTEDWKENLPATGVKGGDAYESVGEYANPLTPAKKLAVVPGALEAASKAGLYAGALRKDLLHSHATDASNLLGTAQGNSPTFPRELYNLSLGITRNKPMDFSGNDTVLIPRFGAFDPKTSPSSLSAFDSFSPRHNQGTGERADEVTKRLRELKITHNVIGHHFDKGEEPPFHLMQQNLDLENAIQDQMRQRLIDRHISRFPKGGQFQESAGKPPSIYSLPEYGRGGYGRQGLQIETPEADVNPHMLSYAKRFPSFKDYEKSPYGALRLDPRTAGEKSEYIYDDVANFFRNNEEEIRKAASRFPYLPHKDSGNHGVAQNPQVGHILQELARGTRGERNEELEKQARELIRKLRTSKSDYGELKVFGPVGLHSDNFAGVLANKLMDPRTLKQLERGTKDRGLQFKAIDFDTRNPYEQLKGFNAAKEMQEARQ